MKGIMVVLAIVVAVMVMVPATASAAPAGEEAGTAGAEGVTGEGAAGGLVGTRQQAEERKYFTPLRTQDIILQVAWGVLHGADWMQTLDIKNHPDVHETNPILGKHPSDGTINTFFLASAVIHTAIVWALPREKRVYFQGIGITIKGITVASNKRLELAVAWPF